MSSVEYLVESVFLALFRAQAELSGFGLVHQDEDTATKKDVIAVGATASERDLAGPRGDRLDVTCEFRGTTTDKHRNDVIASGMRSAILSASAVDEIEQFSGFWILDEEMSGEREESENARLRTITVPVIAVAA